MTAVPTDRCTPRSLVRISVNTRTDSKASPPTCTSAKKTAMSTFTLDAGRRASPFDFEGMQLLPSSPGFKEAIARAYSRHRRPRCLCRAGGVEMYIARLADGYIVKRMPETGDRHAPDCPSYEPPAELSGVRPLLGTAIREDPGTG